MKTQLLNIAGHLMDRLSRPFRWQLYSDCVTSDDSTGSHDVPCGVGASRLCDDICAPVDDLIECSEFSWAHRMPTRISIRSYNVADGTLRPDELNLSFSSVTHRHSLKCSTAIGIVMIFLDWVNMDIIRFMSRAEAGFRVFNPAIEEVMTEEQKLVKSFEKATENPRWQSFSFALVVSRRFHVRDDG